MTITTPSHIPCNQQRRIFGSPHRGSRHRIMPNFLCNGTIMQPYLHSAALWARVPSTSINIFQLETGSAVETDVIAPMGMGGFRTPPNFGCIHIFVRFHMLPSCENGYETKKAPGAPIECRVKCLLGRPLGSDRCLPPCRRGGLTRSP